MKKTFEGIPVDAGMIQIADYNHYKFYGFRPGAGPSASVTLPKGNYIVKYEVPDCWLDDVKGEATLHVTGPAVWIGDPGYFVADRNWIKYLEAINYGKRMPINAVHINTGGDGGFTLHLEFTKIEGGGEMGKTFYSEKCEECGTPLTDDNANYEYPFILCLDCYEKREENREGSKP